MAVSEFAVQQPIKSNRKSAGRWVLSHLMHHWMYLIVMFSGALGNAALAAVVPAAIGVAFNAAQENDLHTIGIAALWVIASQTARAILQLGRNFSSEIVAQRIERDTREELYTSLLGKSMTFHALQPVGDTMARATNDVRELNLMINPGVNLAVGSSFFILMPIFWAPSYAPQLILAPLVYLVLYVFALRRYLQVLRPIADSVRGAFGRLNSRLAEAIDGIELVKGEAKEVSEIDRFVKNASVFRDATVAQGRVEARFIPLLLLGVVQALGFAHSYLLYRSGVLEIGDLVGYNGLLLLFGFPTFVSLFVYSQLSRGMAGARRILALINAETSLGENKAGYRGKMLGRVTFQNVSFSYVDGVDVLEDISFDIPAGQTVALVGQTGAGKSSLAHLLNRTYDVHSGSVKIDGKDVREWHLGTLRRQISIIEQDIFLFSRSIAENIAFGIPQATQAQVMQAAKSAQAHDFIMEMPEGYETVIGERGVTLSGGQRQRLALARAFLTEPSILVLDDSTSAVDSATEDQIQRAITGAAARQTTLLITHRLSQIRWADQVVLLRKGRVVAVGSHDELMKSYPAYRHIFEQG